MTSCPLFQVQCFVTTKLIQFVATKLDSVPAAYDWLVKLWLQRIDKEGIAEFVTRAGGGRAVCRGVGGGGGGGRRPKDAATRKYITVCQCSRVTDLFPTALCNGTVVGRCLTAWINTTGPDLPLSSPGRGSDSKWLVVETALALTHRDLTDLHSLQVYARAQIISCMHAASVTDFEIP